MGSYSDEIDAAIKATAAKAGMSPAEWKAIASIESSLNPQSNVNRGTQYKGLFQVGSRGSDSEWATHGSGNIYNAMDNANAAASLAARNNTAFEQHFGRAPTPIETYMMHQQGLGFFTRGALTNVAGNLPPEDRTPQNMTHNGLMAYYARKMENRANAFRDPDDPNEIKYNYSGQYGPSGGGGSGGGISSRGGGTASDGAPSDGDQQASTDQSGDDSGSGNYSSALKGVSDLIAKQDAANQPAPLQPMQMPSGITPAMLRARQMAQAMLNLQQQQAGITPPPDMSTGSATQ